MAKDPTWVKTMVDDILHHANETAKESMRTPVHIIARNALLKAGLTPVEIDQLVTGAKRTADEAKSRRVKRQRKPK